MWPDASQTDELLARARGGDAEAVGALLDRHREALRRMVSLRMDPVLGRRVDQRAGAGWGEVDPPQC